MQQICEGILRLVRSCAAGRSRLQPDKQIFEWPASKATVSQQPQDMCSSQKTAASHMNLPQFPQLLKDVHSPNTVLKYWHNSSTFVD